MTGGNSMHRKVIAAALAAMFCAAPAWALNKCTDSAGKVTYQADPCPRSDTSANVKIWGEAKPLTPYRPGSMPLIPDPPKQVAPPVVPNASLSGPPQAARLISIYQRWIDLDTLARSTARIALAGPVGKMQDLLREARETPVKPCAQQAKTALVTLISGNTDAMLAFMRDNAIGSSLYDAAYRDEQVKAFEGAVGSMNCGKP